MAFTDAQVSELRREIGPPVEEKLFYILRQFTDEDQYPVRGEAVAPPTVGQLWPRGDRLSR